LRRLPTRIIKKIEIAARVVLRLKPDSLLRNSVSFWRHNVRIISRLSNLELDKNWIQRITNWWANRFRISQVMSTMKLSWSNLTSMSMLMSPTRPVWIKLLDTWRGIALKVSSKLPKMSAITEVAEACRISNSLTS
jgi:hypothetical protein